MISTLYLLLLIAFQCWYISSQKVKHKQIPEFLKSIGHKNTLLRMIGTTLLLITGIVFVMSMGCMAGVCAFIIGLMSIAGLAVVFNPFRYISIQNVFILYAVSVVFEFYI